VATLAADLSRATGECEPYRRDHESESNAQQKKPCMSR
jgi:hypothetical protein